MIDFIIILIIIIITMTIPAQEMFYSLCGAIFIFILEYIHEDVLVPSQLELCRKRIVVQVFWRHQRRGRETAPREQQV